MPPVAKSELACTASCDCRNGEGAPAPPEGGGGQHAPGMDVVGEGRGLGRAVRFDGTVAPTGALLRVNPLSAVRRRRVSHVGVESDRLRLTPDVFECKKFRAQYSSHLSFY